MSRIEHDFMGISARREPPSGADPNYRGWYRGMRMRGGPSQAPYGFYRWEHADDLGTQGGFTGAVGRGLPAGDVGPAFNSAAPPATEVDFDEWGGGGVRRHRYLRSFTARRQLEPGDEAQRALAPRDEPRLPVAGETEHRPDYSNRGLSPGGYAEAWARAPMRGSRDR